MITLVPACSCTERDHAPAAALAADVATTLRYGGFLFLDVEAHALDSGVHVSRADDEMTYAQAEVMGDEIAAYLNRRPGFEARASVVTTRPHRGEPTHSIHVGVTRPYGWTGWA